VRVMKNCIAISDRKVSVSFALSFRYGRQKRLRRTQCRPPSDARLDADRVVPQPKGKPRPPAQHAAIRRHPGAAEDGHST
jgi:hypothetical protein